MAETTQTIIGEFYAPADENGTRKRIIIQVDPKNVVDSTGKTLEQMLAENQYSDASTSQSGLMSPQMVINVNNLMADKLVISDTEPGEACMWYQIKDQQTGTVE